MKIHYATGNKGKFVEASQILQRDLPSQAGWEIVHTPLHLEEMQGTSRQIASHKIREAFRKLKEPCIIDDVSLYCPCLGGLPGPYIRSFLEALGDGGLSELVSHYEDQTCTVTCLIAFLEDECKEPHYFEGSVKARIVAPRGSRKAHTHSWNAIVLPEGSRATFAEMSLEEMSRLSPRFKALTHFRDYLLSHQVGS